MNESGQPAFVDVDVIKKEILKLLKNKTHILVGHNLFGDLIFLYKTFFGNLPVTVMEFTNCISSLFPTVLDTKYMATHDGDAMQPNQSLKDLHDESTGQRPTIVLDESHLGYGGRSREHEAGYDSAHPYAVYLFNADTV